MPVGGFRWIFWFCRCLSAPFLVSSVAFFGNVGGHRWPPHGVISSLSVPVGGFRWIFLVLSVAFFGNVSGHRWPLIGVISSLSVPVGGFFGFVGAFRCLFWFHRWLFGGHRWLSSVPVGARRWISVDFLVLSVPFGAFFGFIGGFFWQCRWPSVAVIGACRWIFWFCRCLSVPLVGGFFGNVGGHRWLSRLGLFGPALVAMLWVLEILGRKQAGEPLYKYIYI